MKQEDVTVEEVLSISRMNTPVSDDSDDDETTAETDYLVTEVHRDPPRLMCNIAEEQKVHWFNESYRKYETMLSRLNLVSNAPVLTSDPFFSCGRFVIHKARKSNEVNISD